MRLLIACSAFALIAASPASPDARLRQIVAPVSGAEM
jgi:hypothetical protein